MTKYYSRNMFTGDFMCQCGEEFPDEKALFKHMDGCSKISPTFRFSAPIMIRKKSESETDKSNK